MRSCLKNQFSAARAHEPEATQKISGFVPWHHYMECGNSVDFDNCAELSRAPCSTPMLSGSVRRSINQTVAGAIYMTFQLEQAIEILSRTPATLNSLLRNVSDEWTHKNEGGESWSPFDVLGHLIHGEEADWIPRARIILDHGTARAFDPFDRFAMFEESKGKSMNELLDSFESLRRKSLEELHNLNITSDKLALRGTHPSLGEVTLGQLLSTWVVHDLSHTAQIARVMCRQYAEEVGPWAAFLPILDR